RAIPTLFGHAQRFTRLGKFLEQAVFLRSHHLGRCTALLVPANEEPLEFGIRRGHDLLTALQIVEYPLSERLMLRRRQLPGPKRAPAGTFESLPAHRHRKESIRTSRPPPGHLGLPFRAP